MLTLAERLALALDRLPGASQAALAAHCGVKPLSVSDWFSGETKTLKAASARRAAEYLHCRREWLETGIGDPGWIQPELAPVISPDPMHGGMAQEMSLQDWKVAPLKTAEELMSYSVPDEFRFALPDEAMAPTYPKGLHIIFSRSRAPRPGRLVLVDVPGAGLHVRNYTQGLHPEHWLAAPMHTAYRTFDSADGIRIIGVFRGTYDPSDD